jgi:predicted nuclease of predicted toxin-antitoxin system
LPDFPPFYVDESLSQVFLPEALRQRGFTVYRVTDKFERGVTDPEWLPVAGENGWIVLTKDKAIRKRPNEMTALVNSGVRAFVLSAGEITGPDQATLFVRVLPQIVRFVEQMPAPFLIRVGKDGRCEVLHPPA